MASIGPSYLDVAKKYNGDLKQKEVIAQRIINGSVGLWGEHAMSAHPDLSPRDAGMMVDYIMSLAGPSMVKSTVPLQGTYVTQVPARQNGKGGYLLRAAYTDKGSGPLKALTSEKIIALRNPVLDAEKSDFSQGTQLLTTPGRSFNIVENGGYIGYRNLDLTDISEVLIRAEAPARNAAAGGVIEIRLDKPDGPLLAATEQVGPVEVDFRAELAKMRVKWEAGGKKGPEPSFRELRARLAPVFAVPLSGVSGRHDVYFVVKNPAAKPGQILVQLKAIEFKQGGYLSK